MNPLDSNIFIDSCAFDPKYTPEDKSAIEIFNLHENITVKLDLMIAHSTCKEIEHPNSPLWVKQRAMRLSYTIEVSLEPQERQRLHEIELILAGNGKIENIKEDAKHIFECQKYGSYFITTDERIISKRNKLKKFSIIIYKPSEFLNIVKTEMAKKVHSTQR